MPGETINAELREALEELQQYLSDSLPPLVVADSVKVLLRYSPDLVASSIHSWTATQYRGGTEIPISDYLFHAVKKIQLMSEFHLVPQGPFEAYLEELKERVLVYCPDGDRDFLRQNLGRLREATSTSATTASPDVLFRQMPSEAAAEGTTCRVCGGSPFSSSGSSARSARKAERVPERRRSPRRLWPRPRGPRRAARSSSSIWSASATWVST
jgi:hypothetical protein